MPHRPQNQRTTARERAEAVDPGDTVPWRALEVAAFAAEHAVLRVLDPKGERARRSARPPVARLWWTVRSVALALVLLVVLFAPVFGMARLLSGGRASRSDPIDPHDTIPDAGVLFAVGLVVLVLFTWSWVRDGRPRDPGLLLQSQVATVTGAVSAALVAAQGSRAGVDRWELWIVPVLATTVLGVVAWVWQAVTRRARAHGERDRARDRARDRDREQRASGAARGGRGTAVEPLRPVRLAVERLPVHRREAVRADLHAAIEDLLRRGVIDDDVARAAREADLGRLALRMSQPVPGRTPDPARD